MGKDESYSLDRPPVEAPLFYGFFLAVVVVGIIVLMTGVDIVKLNVVIELMDGLLMPLAVGFLFCLASSEALPPEKRVTGLYKVVLAICFSFCSILSLFSAFYGMIAGD